MEKLYTVSKTRPGADCGSDHEHLIAKFRLKSKRLGKMTSSKVEQIWGSNHRAITGSHFPDISKVKNPVL